MDTLTSYLSEECCDWYNESKDIDVKIQIAIQKHDEIQYIQKKQDEIQYNDENCDYEYDDEDEYEDEDEFYEIDEDEFQKEANQFFKNISIPIKTDYTTDLEKRCKVFLDKEYFVEIEREIEPPINTFYSAIPIINQKKLSFYEKNNIELTKNDGEVLSELEIKHVIGTDGKVFKAITKKTNVAYIWYNEEHSIIEVYGHRKNIKNAIDRINERIRFVKSDEFNKK